MTKVKIIYSDINAEDLNSKINSFLANNSVLKEVIDIKELQSFNYPTVLIIYKEVVR